MIGIYVHVPYCLRKCGYCAFLSHPVAAGSPRLPEYAAYVAREAALRLDEAEGEQADSLFFGGGTPSLLPEEGLRGILDAARARLHLREDAEITLEANPETVTSNAARAWARMGINRVSMGAQACQPSLLKLLGRGHGWEDTVNAVETLRSAGIENLSLDLMYGLPGQSLADWRETLDAALRCGTPHISCYALALETGTPLHRAVEQGHMVMPDEDLTADQLELAEEILIEAGMTRYEISNYAPPQAECRHNLHYWEMDGWIALGCGAHGQTRVKNPCEAHLHYGNHAEEARWKQCIDAGILPIAESENEQGEAFCTTLLMMGLRLARGVSAGSFQQRTGVDLWAMFGSGIEQAVGNGLLCASGRDRIAPTPRGMNLHNRLLLQVLGERL